MLHHMKSTVPVALGLLLIGMALGGWLYGPSGRSLDWLVITLVAVMFLSPVVAFLIERAQKASKPLAEV